MIGSFLTSPAESDRERSSLDPSVSATIVAGHQEVKEISPLKQRFFVAIRMAVVLVFLLGMPLVDVPQIAEHLRGMLITKPTLQAMHEAHLHSPSGEQVDAIDPTELATAVTMLASDRSPPPTASRNPAALSVTIETLKAQFVSAGVSYMILERIGPDSAQYRFQFDVPVAAGSAYRKRFQVIDDAPDAAMRRALAELHQWRVADREPAHLERPTVMLR
ncbi:MAG: hypothetical protein HYV60_12825 [Planctomycetia bacterium]|nr:hypothetical protein [Planctomycetia bacterium]